MPTDGDMKKYFHSVRLDAESAGCVNCIKTCPTEAWIYGKA